MRQLQSQSNVVSYESCIQKHNQKLIFLFLMLYIPCVMFISPFTDQHLSTIQCILDHILIIAPMNFGLTEDGVNEQQNLLEQ